MGIENKHEKTIHLNMKKQSILIFAFILLGTILGYSQKTYQPTWEFIDSCPVSAWFEAVKYGIFIYWGFYSFPAYSPTKCDKAGIYE
jgi:hypothetical protein